MAIAALMLMTIAVSTVGCKSSNVSSKRNNSHKYVDLGLPSGTLWATCNVGANKPEEFGDYFAWGETTAKTTYDWKSYKYAKGTSDNDPKLTKYCRDSELGDNGFTDDLTILQPSDDAATVNWGNEWCVPTESQWKELFDNTIVTWTTLNGVSGRLYTASNGNSLFLPAIGERRGDELDKVGKNGNYWSNSNSDLYSRFAMYCRFGMDWNYIDCGEYRCYGLPVRPVRVK